MTTRNHMLFMTDGHRKRRLPFLQRAASTLLSLATTVATASQAPQVATGPDMTLHPYVGMWVTDDKHVRHQLLPGGRYDEARGEREGAYRGRYAIKGGRIEYVDDTGFTADGEFVDGVLYHGGMVLRRTTSLLRMAPPKAE